MTPALPYVFDGPYAGCYANPSVAMDPRHVFILHDVLKSWPFRNALELGSFCGASSTAFIEAINGGHGMIATFCDVDLKPSLIDVLANCRRDDRVRFTQEHSWDVLESGEDFDFILVDANHDLESVSREIRRLTLRKPLCLMAHDTSAAAAGYVKAEGAALLKETFAGTYGYFCIEDNAKRPDERTDRGLFLATTSISIAEKAAEVFSQWKD